MYSHAVKLFFITLDLRIIFKELWVFFQIRFHGIIFNKFPVVVNVLDQE